MKGIIFALAVGLLVLGCAAPEEECGVGRAYVCGSDGNTYTNECFAKKAGVAVAYEGQCNGNATSGNCLDSDMGKNVLEAGTVAVGGQTFDDSCATPSEVFEYYCLDNAVQSERIACPAGTECRGGMCAEYLCSDTDGGRFPGIYGVVRKGPENATDICISVDEVKEYHCEGNSIASENIACGSGEVCMNGACVEAACMDSDGGYNIYAKGTLRAGSATYSDYCSGTSSVYEYYCSGDSMARVVAACGDGHYCSDGACREYTCTDTDGGKDENEYGIVRKGGREEYDECHDSVTVTEYYCEGNDIRSSRMECGSGRACEDGECVRVSCTDTDGGNRRAVAGTVTYGSGAYSDQCIDLFNLREYFCSGSRVANETILCTGYGELCYRNVCSPAECEDSDGGLNKDVYGTATIRTENGYSSSESDSCVDERSVREKFCSDFKISTRTMDCGIEEVCSSGRCIEAACEDSEGGRSYLVPGTITKGALVQKDRCDELDPDRLHEYYCAGNVVMHEVYECPAGCIADRSGVGYCVPL